MASQNSVKYAIFILWVKQGRKKTKHPSVRKDKWHPNLADWCKREKNVPAQKGGTPDSRM